MPKHMFLIRIFLVASVSLFLACEQKQSDNEEGDGDNDAKLEKQLADPKKTPTTKQTQVNPTPETVSDVNKCSTPLTIESISCVKGNYTYVGTLSYITATTYEEQDECAKKYNVRMAGCLSRFIAVLPDGRDIVCASPTTPPNMCNGTKEAWQRKLEHLGYQYQCSSNAELINEGVLPPLNNIPNCSRISPIHF